jgi:uncharacterized protein (UPF0332 family)
MSELVAKAREAARGARALLDIGELNGAVSRAYYAMFEMARAVLRDIDPKLAAAKTHTTIIARFSKHVVKEKALPQELGRALRRVFDARIAADYSDVPTTREQAEEVIEVMEQFLDALSRRDINSSK